jgi:hypothetical protein
MGLYDNQLKLKIAVMPYTKAFLTSTSQPLNSFYFLFQNQRQTVLQTDIRKGGIVLANHK